MHTHINEPAIKFRQPKQSISVPFPAPPAEALVDEGAARDWFTDSLDRADETGPSIGRGLPQRPENDAQIFALARSAPAVHKGRIVHTLAVSGRLANLFTDKPLPSGANLLLHRLAGLLSDAQCSAGKYEIRVTNGTLADELNVTERSISRSMAQLNQAGFVYRHYTTGAKGLDRISIDLGPLVARLDELKAQVAQRAADRAEARHELKKCSTTQTQESSGDDSIVYQNTTDQISIKNSTVTALKGSVAPDTEPHSFLPSGIPDWTPTPRQVTKACPKLREWIFTENPDWSDITGAARGLSAKYGLSEYAWGRLCIGLSREWAAVLVGIVAEKPAGAFNRSGAANLDLKKAGYLAGIARKIAKGEPVNVLPSWYRHKKAAELSRQDNRYETN